MVAPVRCGPGPTIPSHGTVTKKKKPSPTAQAHTDEARASIAALASGRGGGHQEQMATGPAPSPRLPHAPRAAPWMRHPATYLVIGSRGTLLPPPEPLPKPTSPCSGNAPKSPPIENPPAPSTGSSTPRGCSRTIGHEPEHNVHGSEELALGAYGRRHGGFPRGAAQFARRDCRIQRAATVGGVVAVVEAAMAVATVVGAAVVVAGVVAVAWWR